MKFNTRWLEKLLVPGSERPTRRHADHFAAYHWRNSTLKQNPVRDISATGVYIVTRECWPLGAVISITQSVFR